MIQTWHVLNKAIFKQNCLETTTIWIEYQFLRSSLFVFFFCLSSLLEPSTIMTLVCAFKAELVISFECLHFIGDLDKFYSWFLPHNRQVRALDLCGISKFLRCRVTRLQKQINGLCECLADMVSKLRKIPHHKRYIWTVR